MKIPNFIFQKKNSKKVDKTENNLHSDQFFDIGKLVKEARIHKNLSIKELSELSKISESTINSIENNNKELRPKYPYIGSILSKLEKCLSLKKNSLLVIEISENKNFKNDKNNYLIRRFDLMNSWQGSIFYFIFLILILFVLNRYFISNINVIEIRIIEEKVNEK